MQNESENKWFVAINPAAGKGKSSTISSLLKKLSNSKINYTHKYSEQRLGITSIVKEAIENGYKKILAIGGDGTNNEAVNGIFKQNSCPTEEITYALLPVGTGNDWIKQFNSSQKIDSIEFLLEGETTLLDIGKITYSKENKLLDHFFINVAGFAFDAQVVKDLDAQNNISTSRYVKQIFKSLFSYKPHNASIVTLEQSVSDSVYTVNIGLGKYSGSGMQFVPHGGQNNGQFAVTVVQSMSPYRVIAALPLIYNGKIERHKKVTCFHSSSVEIKHNGTPIPCEVDGEFLGTTPCKLSIIPKSLKVIVPS